MDKFDLKDLNKKYAATFIQYKEKEQQVWQTCYVDSIVYNEETGDKSVKGIVKNNTFAILDSRSYDFKFDFPPTGIVNYKKTVLVSSLVPMRQWKKAVYPDIYRIRFPLVPLIDKIETHFVLPKVKKHPSFKWKVEEVHELFSSFYFSFEEALSLLKKGSHSACAISKEFYLTPSHYNDAILVCNECTTIAEIKEDGSICYICPLFEQELKDYFARSK